MKICINCKEEKHEDAFPWVHGPGTTKRNKCKPCYNVEQRKKHAEKRAIEAEKKEEYKASESLTILDLVARKDAKPSGYYCR